MSITINLVDVVIPLLFLIATIEFYNSILILFLNREPLFLIFRLIFFLYKLLPIKKETKKKRIDHAMTVYKKRIKLYGIFGLIGGAYYAIIFGMEIISLID